MNRHERGSFGEGEAVLEYRPVEFRVVKPGAYVTCAVTGVQIPLDVLRYWSVEHQEPYATPEAVLQRIGARPKKAV